MSQKSPVSYTVRALQLSDCEQVHDIYEQVGFWIYKHVNQIMHRIDPDGLIVAQDNHTGQILGICAGVNVSDDLAFIGQYAVRPEFQGHGIGSAMWSAVTAHIGPDRNVSLYAAPKMVDKYKAIGFAMDSQIRMHYFSGQIDCKQLTQSVGGVSVVTGLIDEDLIHKVIAYDTQVTRGIDRSLFIRLLVNDEDTITSVALNENQEVVGYGVLAIAISRKARTDQIYANDGPTAELLLTHCCRWMTGRGITDLVYRCWNSSAAALDIPRKMNLKFDDKDPLLFTKHVYQMDKQKIYSPSNGAFYPF